MRSISNVARAGALALAATAILAGPASAEPQHARTGALFVQTDDPSGNTVVTDAEPGRRVRGAGRIPDVDARRLIRSARDREHKDAPHEDLATVAA
jgi:hypothetical protein